MNHNNKSINFRLDLRLLVLVLAVVIVTMLLLWRPWSGSTNENQVIKVTGEATLKAEPDEYAFSPRYSATSANKDTALQTITAKSSELTKSLKELGVPDSKIKTNIDGYEDNSFPERPGTDGFVYNLTLSITTGSKDEAQKIQDFLSNTGAEGSITPFANFSESKRKELENQARDDATKDARRKAEQSANNLGFKLSKVKSVEDGSGFGSVEPYPAEARTMDMTARPSIQVMPGENELKYSVTVTYYVR